MRNNIYYLIFSVFFFSSSAFSAKVELKYAQRVARNFYSYYSLKNNKSVSASPTEVSEVFVVKDVQDTLLYVFNFTDTGFVVISADDRIRPVLGFSFESNYSNVNQPDAFSEWLEFYKKQIVSALHTNLQPDLADTKLWDIFFNNNVNALQLSKGAVIVGPLVTAKWDQTKYYNERCPVDATGPGGHVLTGCVATAMGLVMNYYKFPSQGVGSYSYRLSSYGLLSANFGKTFYNWNNMTDKLYASNPDVAMLLYHLGISVAMDYGPVSSSTLQTYAQYALITNFKYPYARSINRTNDAYWIDSLKKYLDLKQPIMYGGFPLSTDTSGHSFVCDGYNDLNYFHFNFGWSGAYNGYYLITSIVPGGLNFSYRQSAIVNIMPDKSVYPYYCSSNLTTMTGTTGTIFDGSGPIKDYKNNSDCRWLINPSTTNQNIILTFNEFNTQSDKDFVTIYNGASTSDLVLAKLSGTSLPKSVVSKGNQMLIVFTSDDSITAPGFQATYSLSEPVYCSGIVEFNSVVDTISDGSESKNYSNNSLCKWLIKPTGANSITLHFVQFDTELNYDKLKIIDNTTNTVIQQLSGNTLPADITVNTSEVLLIFTSNSIVTAGGWKLYFTTNELGVHEYNKQTNINIFPNPANNTVQLTINTFQKLQDVVIDLYSMEGEVIQSYKINDVDGAFSEQVDISHLSEGMYAFRIKYINRMNELSTRYINFIKSKN